MLVVGPALAALSLATFCPPGGAPAAEPVRVMVLAVIATDRNNQVAPRLEEIAEQMRKHDPSLTGFRIERFTGRPTQVGRTETFKLVEDAVAEVTVTDKDPQTGRVAVTLKPPSGGDIHYTCCCGKFFPVCTRYQTKDKDRLIVAVMVRPCPVK
jgi:hypothetical protein